MRLALSALGFPGSPEQSVRAACDAVAQAASAGADLVCFPECFVPGYRALGATVPEVDQAWLGTAHAEVCDAAGRAGVAGILAQDRPSSPSN